VLVHHGASLPQPFAGAEREPVASALVGAALGGAATALASGPLAGAKGALLWGVLAYGGDAARLRAGAWREARAGVLRAERALLARLTPDEQAEWARLAARNRSERIEAIAAPGSAAKEDGAVPPALSLEAFVEYAEARRAGGTAAGAAALQAALARAARADAEAARRREQGAGAAPASAAAETSGTGGGGTDGVGTDVAARWLAWLPVHVGADADRDRLRRLAAKLREVDELLGVAPEDTAADAAAARERGAVTAGSGRPRAPLA
jgi:hypothetical protein